MSIEICNHEHDVYSFLCRLLWVGFCSEVEGRKAVVLSEHAEGTPRSAGGPKGRPRADS